MRKEDKKAFVSDYLELCRKYGMCVDTQHDDVPDLKVLPISGTFVTFEALQDHMELNLENN